MRFGKKHECYRVTETFPKREYFALASQIQRAVASVPANIAEGRARLHVKEFLYHLSVAYGSLAELETHLQLAERLGYLDRQKLDELLGRTAEIGHMLNGLRKSLGKPETNIRNLTPGT